jgi:hypothetical protein
MSATYDPNAVVDLERFDLEYKPSEMAPGLESLPDGDYGLEITSASIERTEKTRDAILRIGLRVASGSLDGHECETVYFFRSQQNVDILGNDLCQLGLDADCWTAQHGRRFSEELPKALGSLIGVRFRARKLTKPNPKKTGEFFHNLRINGRIPSGSAAMPPAYRPNGTPAVSVPDSSVDTSIPF